jgi:hypothetical protein
MWIFAWAVSTADLSVAMTSSGLSELKIAVPATMTLLPKPNTFQINLAQLGQSTNRAYLLGHRHQLSWDLHLHPLQYLYQETVHGALRPWERSAP